MDKTVQTDYLPRIADRLLQNALKSTGAIQIVGPKWCGKTTTAEQVAASAVYFQDPDKRASLSATANEQPSLLLRSEKPLLLDEWQDAPQMWDAVRFAVDREKAVGQYILTGSATPVKSDEIMHSGTGRFSRIRMRPMSLYESRDSNGSVPLSALFNGEDISGQCGLSLEDMAFLIARGGWPVSVARNNEQAFALAKEYLGLIAESDISRVDGVDKNPKRVDLLMRSLARNESGSAAMTTLRQDMAAELDGTISTNTIAVYLNALRRLYVIEEQEAWAPAVRAKTAIRTSPVRRYCDPSLAAALLRLTPDKMLVDFNTFGLLFESLCVRDIRSYADAIDGSVYFYHDSRGLESDVIVELGDGRWGAIEVKLEQSRVDGAITTLSRIKQEVRSQHSGEACFLAVVTTGQYAYRRADGIYIVPLGCLCP